MITNFLFFTNQEQNIIINNKSNKTIQFIGTMGLPASYGGFETAVEQISKKFIKKKWKIEIGSIKRYKSVNEFLKIIWTPQVGIPSLDRILREFFLLLRAILSKDDKIYHIFGPSFFILVWKLFNKKVIITADGLEWKRKCYGKITQKIVKFSYSISAKYSDVFITDAKFIKKYYNQKYKVNSIYIPYGGKLPKNLPETEIKKTLAKFGVESKKYYIFVGRLVPEKGVHILISAFSKKNRKFPLLIIGSDPFSGKYEELLRKNSNKDIKFLGYLFGEKFDILLSNSRLHFRPSLNESEGTNPVAIESIWYDLPIIASDAPQNIELFSTISKIYPRSSIEKLARLISEIEGKDKLDVGLKKYKKLKERYDWKKVCLKLEKIYEGLLNSKHSTD